MGRRKKLTDQIKDRAKRKIEEPRSEPASFLFPSGSTLLNLACSDRADGAFAPGEMVNMIGDKSSGKTFLFLTALAETPSEWDRYFIDAETACNFDFEKLFGNRLEDVGISEPVTTVEEWRDNLIGIINRDRPFVCGLDSFDALTSEGEIAHVDALAKGKKTSGSYGTEKSKASSQLFRLCKRGLKGTESLLWIISQVRENIGALPFMPRYTRSGGKALDFYGDHIIWLAVKKTLKDSRYGETLGQRIQAKVTKNKLTGKYRSVEFDIFYDYGVDDIGSCVDWMAEFGGWKKQKQTISAMGFEGTRKKLIEWIETKPARIEKLKKHVERAWRKREKELQLDRKRKYE